MIVKVMKLELSQHFPPTICSMMMPEFSLDGLTLKLKLQYFDHLM